MALINRIHFAIYQYYFRYGLFPPQSELKLLQGQPGAPIELQDQWHRDLFYATSVDRTRYVIASSGRNGTFERDPSAFMYDIPLAEHLIDADSDDLILANGCYRQVSEPSGMTCGSFDQTFAAIRNTKEALSWYWKIHRLYPSKLDVAELQDLICTRSNLPYALSATDGWHRPLTYLVSDDKRTYVLASAGEDGKFSAPPTLFLKAQMPKIPPDESENEDIIVKNGRKVIWPKDFPF